MKEQRQFLQKEEVSKLSSEGHVQTCQAEGKGDRALETKRPPCSGQAGDWYVLGSPSKGLGVRPGPEPEAVSGGRGAERVPSTAAWS